MTDITFEAGNVVGTWLRQEWPRDTRKEAARAFSCSPKTVAGWLEGKLPMNAHLFLMARRWGAEFVAALYEPAVGTELKVLRIGHELRDVKAQLQRLERKLDEGHLDQVRTVALRVSNAKSSVAHSSRESSGRRR